MSNEIYDLPPLSEETERRILLNDLLNDMKRREKLLAVERQVIIQNNLDTQRSSKLIINTNSKLILMLMFTFVTSSLITMLAVMIGSLVKW